MTGVVRRTEPIWVFGRRIDFNVYDCQVALDTRQYEHSGTNPVRRQKNQIVMHFTAGNGPANGTVGWWNTIAPRPSSGWICPQWNATTHAFQRADRFVCPHNSATHNWSADTGNCPVHGVRDGQCPTHHADLEKSHNRASAHYVVELGVHRANAASAYADVIEVVDSNTTTWHGERVNPHSIGIEHSNVGAGWSAANHDTFTGAGAAKRPTNQNRWLHLANPGFGAASNLGAGGDFQAYDEPQYLAMILLLRSLCIKHRIPRRFLGETAAEKMARWHPNSDDLTLSKLMRFRGILSHMNCHANKTCGGPALHRNRLFRGIIDEWWLPVQIDGSERPYYMGPFDPQPGTATPPVGEASYVRFAPARTVELFHDANLDALQDTTSYFDLDRMDRYYAEVESADAGGTFPIGTNKVWHGGVHFKAPAGNRKVYVAASGTIVAARLGGDAATEADPRFGSQRFVLVRHCVYTADEADPGGGTRTSYQGDPTYVFTLYMHLAAVADPAQINAGNPPWFNFWLRRHAGSNGNAIFSPLVDVSVGDWLGECGTFAGNPMVQVEVLSRTELTGAPWNDATRRAFDDDANVICNSPTIDRFVRDLLRDGIDRLDVLRALPEMRTVKAYHKSEWSLTGPDDLIPVLPDAAARRAMWQRLQHFMWVSGVQAVFSDLQNQLCDATGRMWHYHPIAFMEYVNRRVLKENGQVAEPDLRETNVVLRDGFLTDFVNFQSGTMVSAVADAQPLKPFGLSSGAYHFTRADLACQCGATGQRTTLFNLGLLDLAENVRVAFGGGLRVIRSHICPACLGHSTPDVQRAWCVIGNDQAIDRHVEGFGLDVKPVSATPQNCRTLWAAAQQAISVFNQSCGHHGGEPSRADFLDGIHRAVVRTAEPLRVKLAAGTALTPAEAQSFVLHLGLEQTAPAIVWDAWLKWPSRAQAVRLLPAANTGTPGSMLVGTYATRAEAEAERQRPTDAVWTAGSQFETSLRGVTLAHDARVQSGGVVGTFRHQIDAETEKSGGNAVLREI